MSLTFEEKQATKEQLLKSMKLVSMTIDDVAKKLNTTQEKIVATLNLECNIENPWVLKEFLQEEARKQKKTPITFSALKGDYKKYYFLNSEIIAKKIIR